MRQKNLDVYGGEPTSWSRALFRLEAMTYDAASRREERTGYPPP